MNIHAFNFFSKLASAGAEYNATICFVGLTFEKTPESFKNDLEDSGIIFFDKMEDILENKELLEELGGSSAAVVKNKRILNKVLVNELPRFVDATVSTIEMMTNTKAAKETVAIQNIMVKDASDHIASSIGFYGDLDGMIALSFPKSIAKKSCELLIGETTDSEEDILDALAEFVNIIAGRVKSLLLEQNINVNITLPRTYPNIKALLEVIESKKGVQVDLKFNNETFIFFLTR
jgi:CheY-specific phosphatase CheX